MNGWQSSLLGYSFRVAQPEYLAIIPIAVLGMILALVAAGRRSSAVGQLAPERLLERIAPNASSGRSLARSLLGWASLLLGGLAMMQPQCGSHTELSKRYGIDLVIALDASKSMLARDVKPSRLERAKLELSGLLDKLKGDRVGIVVFAGQAFVQCPLTSDYAAAKMFLRAVDPNNMPVAGTDLGSALDTSRDLLMEADRGAKSRAIVVLSDGEDFGDDLDDSIKQLKSDGIRVIAVGVGSAAGEPIPLIDKKSGAMLGYAKDKQGNTVMTRLDEAGLSAIADKTDGVYIPSVPGSVGVGAVAEELERMEKSELESRITVSYEDRYLLLLAPALACLLLAATLRPGRPRHGLRWAVSGVLQALGVGAVAGLGAASLVENAALRSWIIAGTAAAAAALLVGAVALDALSKAREGQA